MFFKKKRDPFEITFATSCYERDWEHILKRDGYLKTKMIENHSYPFKERILIINNVLDYDRVSLEAKKKVDEGILTNFYIAKDFEKEVLDFFKLKREDFKAYNSLENDWVFYNSICVLTAIYLCGSKYFLYHTGDVYLENRVNWIDQAIDLMNKHEKFKVANLIWNDNYEEAKKEALKKKREFFISEKFSDQLFLVQKEDFRAPIYNEIREDSHHYPKGDVFEKRVFSFMKNHGWKRMTYRNGSYIHKSF